MRVFRLTIAGILVVAIVRNRQLYACWDAETGINAVRNSMAWAIAESRLFKAGEISRLTA